MNEKKLITVFVKNEMYVPTDNNRSYIEIDDIGFYIDKRDIIKINRHSPRKIEIVFRLEKEKYNISIETKSGFEHQFLIDGEELHKLLWFLDREE